MAPAEAKASSFSVVLGGDARGMTSRFSCAAEFETENVHDAFTIASIDEGSTRWVMGDVRGTEVDGPGPVVSRTMADVGALLRANLHDVFGNRDAASRRRAIEATFAPDVVFTDPDESITGWDALERKAAGLIDGTPPEFAFVDAGPAYIADGIGVQAWEFGPVGAPVARGVDVITVQDGRVVELRTVLAG